MVQIGDLEDPSELEIGMPVRLEFRRISWDGEAGVIFYGHKAVTGLSLMTIAILCITRRWRAYMPA